MTDCMYDVAELNVAAREANGHSARIDSTERLTKQIAQGGGVAFIGLLCGQGISFGLNILLTRVLGSHAYGLYVLGQSVVNFNRQFSVLGLHQGVVRFGSKYLAERDRRRLKGTIISAMAISATLGTGIGVLLFILSDTIAAGVFKKPELAPVLRAFSFAYPFYSLLTIASSSARAFRRMEYDVGIQRIFQPLANLAIVSIIFFVGFRLLGAVYGFVASLALAMVFGMCAVLKIFPDLISGIKAIYELKKFFSFSLFILLTGVAQFFVSQADRFVLGRFASLTEVGIYNTAATMGLRVGMILGAFSAIFAPIISATYSQGQIKQLGHLMKTVTKWGFSLTLPVFLVFLLFANKIMGLFGDEFVDGWPQLVILAFAQLVRAGIGPVGFVLIMTGHQMMDLANWIVGGVVSFVLSIWMVQTHGSLGVAIAICGSIALMAICRLVEVYLLFRIHPYKLSYWKPVMGGAVCIILGIWVKFFLPASNWVWIVAAIALGVVYLSILAALGFDQDDQIVLAALIQRIKYAIRGAGSSATQARGIEKRSDDKAQGK